MGRTDRARAPGKTSADSDVSTVRITRIVPGECIVQEVDFDSEDPAFQGTMIMEWSLRSAPDGTEVEFQATNVPAGILARDHAAGMTSSLVNLAEYLEP
ncbi:SRPBCC domain-containing protein [Dermacoccaceae bacterium W4C1]